MKRREKRPILGRDIHLNRKGNSLQMKNDAGTMMQMKMVNYAQIFASRFSRGGVQKSSLFSTKSCLWIEYNIPYVSPLVHLHYIFLKVVMINFFAFVIDVKLKNYCACRYQISYSFVLSPCYYVSIISGGNFVYFALSWTDNNIVLFSMTFRREKFRVLHLDPFQSNSKESQQFWKKSSL